MGWEEGDVICGLVVVGDETVATGMMRVTCDAEPDGGKKEEEEVEEVVDAVSERELVTVGAARQRLHYSPAGTRSDLSRRRRRPPRGPARSPGRRRRSTRGRSGASWRVARSWPSTASVSISTRRPKMWSAGSVSWRIWPKCSERGSDMSIMTWVAISGLQLDLLVGQVPPGGVEELREQLVGAELVGLLEQAALGPDLPQRAGRRPRGRRAGSRARARSGCAA